MRRNTVLRSAFLKSRTSMYAPCRKCSRALSCSHLRNFELRGCSFYLHLCVLELLSQILNRISAFYKSLAYVTVSNRKILNKEIYYGTSYF